MIEEGARCPNFGPDCCGRLRVALPENTPIGSCEDSYLLCDDCGWDSRDHEEEKKK